MSSQNIVTLLIILILPQILAIPAIVIPLSASKAKRKAREQAINEYMNTTYYKMTGIPYDIVMSDKGKLGEYSLYLTFRHLENYGMRFLFNVYVPKPDGSTTEIDMLTVSCKGIFVFENKNYSGFISGYEDNEFWYQTITARNGKRTVTEFYNPVMQNRTHVKYLKKLLGDGLPMYSVIVFSDDCSFQGVKLNYIDTTVVNRAYALDAFDYIYGQINNDYLSVEDINGISDYLSHFSNVDQSVRNAHIENVSRYVYKNTLAYNGQSRPAPVDFFGYSMNGYTASEAPEKQPEQLFCPVCGNKLVIRTAKKGRNTGVRFYGCSAYPMCNYTRKIEG